MIKTENISETLKRTYSDENFYIRKVGTEEIYCEAVDLITANYEYEETDELVTPKETTE